jgi:hypothetical protein
MPPEDQNIGETPPPEVIETPTTAAPESSSEPSPTTDSPPINPVSAALDAFNSELNKPEFSQPAALPPPNAAAKTTKRDYSGLEEHEKEHFSRMSTQAYEYLYPRHLKTKELEKQLQERTEETEKLKKFSLYDQEGAWKLAPEYNELSSNLSRLQQEASFWREQLANARAGNKVRLLVRDAQGNIGTSDEVDPDPTTEADIISALQQAHMLVGRYQDKVSQFETGYKQQHTDYLSTLQQTRDKIFSTADKAKLEAAAAKKLELFPAFTRSKPELKMLAEAMVIIDGLMILAGQNKARNSANTLKTNTARNAGPPADSIQSGSSKGVKTVKDIMAEFERAKAMV